VTDSNHPLASIVIASRESALALWQAENIRQRLQSLYPQTCVTINAMTTQGDRLLASRLTEIGGKGLFVKELEEALAAGSADIAVHSMKDVPMVLPAGYTLAAMTEREDPRDVLVSNLYDDYAQMPPGSRIGTSSLRRECQIRARFPQLEVVPLRGNVQTRLKKLDDDEYAAIILAAAGLKRLGLERRIRAVLAPEASLPAPGQGALGIECCAHRTDVMAMVRKLDHAPTALCVRAERALSRALSGNCRLPLAAYAQMNGERIRLRGLVANQQGTWVVSAESCGRRDDPETLGTELAGRLRAQGAAEILAAFER
jgi:hydroxymethylbilane synthase